MTFFLTYLRLRIWLFGVSILVYGGVAQKKISYMLIMLMFYHDILSVIYIMLIFYQTYWHTVDGRNPAPPGIYKTLQIMGFYHINWCRISSINCMLLSSTYLKTWLYSFPISRPKAEYGNIREICEENNSKNFFQEVHQLFHWTFILNHFPSNTSSIWNLATWTIDIFLGSNPQ